MWFLNSERDSSKWATLLAVVLALGSGEAAAQLTPDNTFDNNGLKVDVASQVAEGASVTITVTLKASVAANTAGTTPVTVTVTLEPKGQNDATNEDTDVVLNPGTATLDFPANTTSNAVTHEVRGTIPLQTIHDPDAEDETIVLAISASGGGFSITAGNQSGDQPWETITLDDDETQSYDVALAAGAAPREGAPFDVVVRAAPAHVDDSKTLTLQLDDTDYSLDTDDTTPDVEIEGTLNVDTPSFTAVVTPPANDGNRVADTVTVTAYSGTVGNATEEASASFPVADAHALPAPAAVTVEARDATGAVVTSVPEGGAVELTVSVDRGRGNTAATGEALSVALSLDLGDPDQAPTYRLAPDHVDLPAVTSPDGKQSAATVVRLEARVDEFVNDDRLTLDLVTTGEADYGAGSVDSSFEIEVRDTTVKRIAPRPDSAVEQAFDAAQATAAGADGLNPGETFSVAVGDLFEGLAPGSTVDYSATSSDPSVEVSASSTAVTVTAVSAGSAAVRVSARVRADAASAVPQTLANEAAVEHTVTVTDAPLRVELTADPAAAVVEGGRITLTASANRAVLAGEDATVRLAVVGPVVSPPSSVTIAAGATTASAVLTVQDDDEVKDLGSVTVVATGGSLATDPTRLDIAVTEDDVETALRVELTADPAAAVVEGGRITLTASANRAVLAGEDATVRLAVVGPVVSPPSSVTIAAGATTASAVLTVQDDDEVKDLGRVTVVATGGGLATDPTRLDIAVTEDDVETALRVELTADPAAAVVEGGRITLTASANRAVLAGEDATVRLAVVGPVVSPPSSVTIAAGATTASAVLTVQDDDEVKDLGRVTVVATGGGLATDPTRLDIAVTEDDVIALRVELTADPAAAVVEGGRITLTASANRAVLAGEDATVRLAVVGPVVSPPSSVTIAAGATTASAVLTVQNDDEVKDLGRVTVVATGGGLATDPTRLDIAVTEDDVEAALRVELTADPAAAVVEGGRITLTASANRAVLAGEDATVRLAVVGPVVSPPSSVTIAAGATTASAVLTVQDDDEVKDLGRVTVVATGGGLAPDPTRLDIAVTEDDVETTHSYTFAATAARVTEGDAVTLAVTATPAVAEETVVALTAFPVSLVADYTLDPASITLAAGATSGTAELRVTDDEEVEDTETLTVTATGPNKVLIGTVEIMLVDNDAPTVVAKSQAEIDKAFADAVAEAAGADGWTAGSRAAVLDARDLFVVAEEAAVTYAALSSNAAVVTAATSATTVTLEPQAAGTAAITVTATDSASGAIATVSSGVRVNTAVVTYTLSGPADSNLVEGRSYELKVTASAAATTDATFTLRRDRAASDAGDDDFTLEPASIVVAAGATEGTAVLTVADDGEDEPAEALVLFATTAGGDEIGSLAFTLWGASVPVLPLAAQLLLGALLAIGGYRRYLRR